MTPRRLARIVALALVVVFAPPARAETEWRPESTHAVIVGVLRYAKGALSPFSLDHRKDEELYRTLQRRGVPRENISLLLDKQGTLAGIRDALTRTAGRAPPGSTLLFYYAGHGMKGPGGRISFANYDLGGDVVAAAFALEEVTAILRRDFRGSRVLLMADCCHSGGLAKVAADVASDRIAAASLTSADAGSTSTGTWIFTQTVLDALNGDPLIDVNGDGAITLGELNEEVAHAMKNREAQRSGFSSHGTPATWRLAKTDPALRKDAVKGPFRLGEYVLAPDGPATGRGRIVGQAGDDYLVEFYDYSVKRHVRAPANRLRPIQWARHKSGETIAVLWQGEAYQARILQTEGDFHLVSYRGWGPAFDEWVLSDRITAQPASSLQTVQVKWDEKWWPAVVLKTENGRHHIHYAGYDKSWDEWVGEDRIRFPSEELPAEEPSPAAPAVHRSDWAGNLFRTANLLVLPFWMLMIFLPGWRGTRAVFRSPLILAPLPVLYVILVVPILGELGPVLANPKLTDVAAALGRPEGALIGWIHFLAFDLFVGRWVYLDSRERGVNAVLMAPILTLTLLLGPCGLLVYLLVRAAWSKGRPESQASAVL